MSYTLNLYKIRPDSLRRALGSNDPGLLSSIHKGGRTKSTSGRAAKQLVVDGTCDAKVPPHEVGYGLELLCAVLGTRVEAPAMEGVSSHLIAAVCEAAPWVEPLVSARVPLGLPAASDFPVIGHLLLDELRVADGRWEELDIDALPRAVASCCMTLAYACSEALDEQSDLIGFYY